MLTCLLFLGSSIGRMATALAGVTALTVLTFSACAQQLKMPTLAATTALATLCFMECTLHIMECTVMHCSLCRGMVQQQQGVR